MRNRISGYLWGIALIAAGVGMAGNAFHLWDFHLFFDGWWTLFIIVPCIISLIEGGMHTAPFIGLTVGVLLLLSAQGILPRGLVGKLLVPVILVLLGVRLLISRSSHASRGYWNAQAAADVSGEKTEEPSTEQKSAYSNPAFPDCQAVLSKREERFSGWLGGAGMTAVLGHAVLDLRNAVIDHDVAVNITVVMGAADLLLPGSVRAQIKSMPVMGSVDNRTREPAGDQAPTVFVNADCFMGGITVL